MCLAAAAAAASVALDYIFYGDPILQRFVNWNVKIETARLEFQFQSLSTPRFYATSSANQLQRGLFYY